MVFPESVLTIARKAAKAHPSDIEKATDEAEGKIRKLPEFQSLIDAMIRDSIQELIYDARHTSNRVAKRDAGMYGTPAKVTLGSSEAVQRVYQSLYEYRIAGTMLGMLTGEDLPKIAENERNIGEGHIMNARLCERLSTMVSLGKRVQDAVPEKKLKMLFKQVQREVKTRAA